MKKTSSLFISFEGLDGSGKSLQASELCQHLKSIGRHVLLLHEPGSTPLGEEIARLLKWGSGFTFDPLVELFLFNAARSQLVKNVIYPGLKKGKIIVVDRFVDSTLAYQGYGRGLDLQAVKTVNDTAINSCLPDLSVLIDIPVEIAHKRMKSEKDRFETEHADFHRRIRDGYLEISEAEPERWLVVDGRLDSATISQIIWEHVIRRLDHLED